MISMNDQTHVKGRPGSIDHVPVLLAHLRLEWLLQHFPTRVVWAIYVCINGFITIGLLALLALLTGSPFVFPSLGPTAYLFFFSPLAEASSPRNTILGHAIGLICGYGRLRAYRGFQPAFWYAPWRPWRQSPGRCAFAICYWCAHGAVPGKPSTRWGYDPHRFARHHLPAQRARHH